MNFELYILLSDTCNFRCSHCLNSSGPASSRWRISKQEILQLADLIENESRIEEIHFSGGEPTLLLDTMIEIQKAVQRSVRYAITTNGWLGSRFDEVLNQVHLDRVTFSYDKFHEDFLAPDRLKAAIKHCTTKGVAAEINFVFDDLADLALSNIFHGAGARIRFSKLIQSGRGSEGHPSRLIDKEAIHQTCPSLQSRGNERHLEKIIFLPGEGLSSCCGPLTFDKLAKPGFATSPPRINDFETNGLRKQLRAGTFSAQANQLGIDIANIEFGSPCEACTLLYAQNRELPSLSELARQKDAVTFHPASRHLPPSHSKALFPLFEEKYVYLAAPETIRSWNIEGTEKPNSIETRPLHQVKSEAALDFVMKSFYQRHHRYYSDQEIQKADAAGREYFKWNLQGSVYIKGGEIVGAVFGNIYERHAAAKQKTFHIGYWGLAETGLERHEARWIKRDWLRNLFEFTSRGSFPVDAGVNFFNEPAIALVKSRGFQLRWLRLDRK